MNFLKQTVEPWTSVQKKIRVAWPPLPPGCSFLRPKRPIARARSEERQVALDLPRRDLVVVLPPLALLELAVRGLQLGPEDLLAERVRVERLDRLEQGARQPAHLHLADPLGRLDVHVQRDRIPRVELALDAVEAGGEHHRR